MTDQEPEVRSQGSEAETALRMEDIHPRMTPEEKDRARLEIVRVLRGEE